MPPTSHIPSDFESTGSTEAEPSSSTSSGVDKKQWSSPKAPGKVKKPLLIILGLVLLLCLAGGVTAFVISRSTKSTPAVTKTAEQQAAELAKQANDAATASANKGDTQGALDHYEEALIQYQKAGDKAGEQGVKLQIQYYEMVKANEDKTKAAAASSSTTQTP
jgi:uncharacterized protein (UPF0333 family)